MIHIDLFSGIGGFSYALDNVYGKENTRHIFVEWDEFCQAILRKHWPKAEIHGDIRAFANSSRKQTNTAKQKGFYTESGLRNSDDFTNSTDTGIERVRGRKDEVFLITGGFPCQPFSQAGRRKGTADDRYLWPQMLECIALFRPRWVIAENVAGLVTWNNGVVLETVCTDLEKEGYEVQPFIIPACAVGAPHRRDRVWIVANRNGKRQSRNGKRRTQIARQSGLSRRKGNAERRDSWERNWPEVATRLCGIHDGVPRRLDRNPRLKSLGNAIVPQVAEKIFQGIAKIDRFNPKTS